MRPYNLLVKEIKCLPWRKYQPHAIVYLSLCSAKEFGKSLRLALLKYPENQSLAEMANGELKTNNLKFEDYNTYGDHSEFLQHFCNKYGVGPFREGHQLFYAEKDYNYHTDKFSDEEIAMTIFSREQELPGIFKEISVAHDWAGLGLSFFKYYLERHIELDSAEGGHGDLTKSFPTDENVLFRFYAIRLEMYRVLNSFKK